jgi:Fur family transcriptional regulator, ferric uptake regulator
MGEAPADIDRDVHQPVRESLGARGQRYTEQRRRLVEVVVASSRPLAVAELAQAVDQPLSSVYRNVRLLVTVGVFGCVIGSDRQERIEWVERSGRHHHHLLCLDCGLILDYLPPRDIEELIELMAPRVAEAAEFRVTRHSLDLGGVCSDCDRTGAGRSS